MANKQKYKDAKQAAWYADPLALDVIDKKRGKISRSAYLNKMLVDIGMSEGIIQKPQAQSALNYTKGEVSHIVEEVIKYLNQNQNQKKTVGNC